mgnify:CR=1 FL=1
MSAVLAEGQDRRSTAEVLPVALAAMGVVFGDIGTSPLYTMKEVFNVHHGLAVTPANVLGVLSLVFWALTIVVSLKYVVYITRADNRGEGGIMALTSLALRTTRSPRLASLMSAVGLFGAALFYGDGVITPAISVLSAVEGLEVATPAFRPFVLPISLVVLTGLLAGVMLMADPLTLRLVTALVGVSVGIALVHRGRPAARVRPPGTVTKG